MPRTKRYRPSCNGCIYRSMDVDTCDYLIMTKEPRGCHPDDCKALGKYKKGLRRGMKGTENDGNGIPS